MPPQCDWCGERIEDDHRIVRVTEGRRNEMGGTLATFHRATCYDEAADYGWR